MTQFVMQISGAYSCWGHKTAYQSYSQGMNLSYGDVYHTWINKHYRVQAMTALLSGTGGTPSCEENLKQGAVLFY